MHADKSNKPIWVPPSDWGTTRRVLACISSLGHYMYFARGGRAGQDHVLTKLYRHDMHMAQRELQESMSITSASLSEVLSKIESEGYIRRSKSETDKRQFEVFLTPQGMQRATQLMEDRKHFEQQALSFLSQKEQEDLLNTLMTIIANWNGKEN